jgi:2-C-methyl-D-erythritol 4-phosphate cytidylyltransferase
VEGTRQVSAAAVIVAAGSSTRMAAEIRKPLIALAGRTLLEHVCAAFRATPGVGQLVVVAHPSDRTQARAIAAKFEPAAVVPGGERRTDSVRAGVEAVENAPDVVLVHDAARPLVRPALIERALHTAATKGAAVVAVPVRDTIKRSPDGQHAHSTVDRADLWAAQTPQAFRLAEFRQVLERARREGATATDDSALWELFVGPVPLVRGEDENLKVTTLEDLAIAEAILALREHRGRP